MLQHHFYNSWCVSTAASGNHYIKFFPFIFIISLLLLIQAQFLVYCLSYLIDLKTVNYLNRFIFLKYTCSSCLLL